MHSIRRVNPNNITPPIESLEYYFRSGGVTIIQAAFSHSFFVDPDVVRERTPYHPDRARYSRQYYPNLGRGQAAIWKDGGKNRPVILDDNAYAHSAWQGYTGCPRQSGTGYGLRHIWGHPWNPDSFTAGWNLCYMPFWAGMLTEDQHPLRELQTAIKQASWDLYFRDYPVCDAPDFVEDQDVDLSGMLDGQPLLIMAAEPAVAPNNSHALDLSGLNQFEQVKAIRVHTNWSWLSIYKGVLAIQDKQHEPFGSTNVEATSKSIARKILRDTGLSPSELQAFLEEQPSVKEMKQ